VQSTTACACFLVASSQIHAQALLANPSGTTNRSNIPATREAVPDKRISGNVRDGVLTIDGMIAKVQLNYTINNASYMYFFVPGVGTAVLSLSPLPDSIKVKNAFNGSSVSFTVDGHTYELSSQGDILGGGKMDAYVHIDGASVALSRTPHVGFGATLHAPYVWPLSQAPADDKNAHLFAPPSLPSNMVPRTKQNIPAAPAPVTVAQPQATATQPSAMQTASSRPPQ
jgi:hypothetical protein